MTDHIVDANKKVAPEWDKEGNPLNLEAAAEDAYEWLTYIVMHPNGKRGERMIRAKNELRKFLDESI